MPRDVTVASLVRIPARALQLRAVRSSGAGGQNVNKVASKVELHVDVDEIEGLTPAAMTRLRGLAAGRMGADGRLVLRSQLTRDQHRNVEDAYAKLGDLIERALVAPKKRRPTRTTRSGREKRLSGKKRRGALKRFRRTDHADE